MNTILVKAKTGGERYVACVALANTRLDVNRVVRKRLGAPPGLVRLGRRDPGGDRDGDRGA